MRLLYILCCMLAPVSVFSQDCGCGTNFRYVVEKVEKNYSGFSDKVPAAQRAAFDHFTDSLAQLAAEAGYRNCFEIMRSWLAFFKDRHISVSIKDDSSHYPLIRSIFSDAEKVALPEPAFAAYLNNHPQGLDSLEGIWEDETHLYRIGFIRDRSSGQADFAGFILKADSVFWMPGQVKAKIRKGKSGYQAIYFLSRDHIDFKPPIVFRDNTLYAGIFGEWHKLYPGGEQALAVPVAKKLPAPSFQIIDNNNCLFTIPGFGLNYKSAIDSIVAANGATIGQRENLIIDLRNNAGGSVLSFERLLPFIYTKPMISTGSAALATEDNITNYYALYDYPNISDSMKKVFRQEAVTLRAHEGGLYNLWPADTLRLDTVLRYPKKVAIIINENCASSTELFLLKARQSAKVTIYGTHSMGAIDYSDAVTMKMPCSLFMLRYPTSRSGRLPGEPLDNIGVQPNVKIPDNTVDWVQFVMNHIHYH